MRARSRRRIRPSEGTDYAALYLGLRNYTNNLLNHGFTQQDIAGCGSDPLIDAIIPHGGADKIAAACRQHRTNSAKPSVSVPPGSARRSRIRRA